MDLLNNAQFFSMFCKSFMVLLSTLADRLNLYFQKCGLWIGAGSEAKLLSKVAGLFLAAASFDFIRVGK